LRIQAVVLTACLWQLLDPAQNNTFRDHYLGVPFDMSHTLFLATANSTDSIPAPLLDRMEVIRLSGYTVGEKVEIASRYLWPKLVSDHGLSLRHAATPSAEVLRALIEGYTREAGVRSLERRLGALCRRVAVLVASERAKIEASSSCGIHGDAEDESGAGAGAGAGADAGALSANCGDQPRAAGDTDQGHREPMGSPGARSDDSGPTSAWSESHVVGRGATVPENEARGQLGNTQTVTDDAERVLCADAADGGDTRGEEEEHPDGVSVDVDVAFVREVLGPATFDVDEALEVR